MERERERERKRGQEKERERDRETDRKRERERAREREGARERARERERERVRARTRNLDTLKRNTLKRCGRDTGWRRPIGCLKLQVIFRKRAIHYRSFSGKEPFILGFLCGN